MKLKEAGTRSRPAVAEVSLVQLSADGVTIAWPEAVALVTQICEFLIASGTQAFNPSTIVIQATGDVIVHTSTTSDAERSVRALGELLRTNLLATPHPVPLQIIIAQATCTPPFYGSIAELAEALCYYSRSKPEDLTRSIYERWRRDRPPPAHVPRLVHSIRSSLALRVRKFVTRCRAAWSRLATILSLHAARPKWMTHRVLSTTAAILLCIGVAGIAFAAGFGRSAAPALVAKISRANGQASAALVATMGSAVELVKSGFGGSASTSINSTAESQAPQPEPRRRASRPATRTPEIHRAPPAQTGTARIDDREMSPSSIPVVDPAVPPADLNLRKWAEVPSVTSHLPDPASFNEFRVYSAEDTDVAPPIVIERKSPNRLATVNRSHNATAITIVVGEDGRVESAALARRPATFRDGVTATLNLSAVKAWRFQPASKTGWPVKYRTTVWLD